MKLTPSKVLLLLGLFCSLSVQSAEVTLGNDDAPVLLVEYGSLTCDYCIAFHRNVLPRVKKHYIDKGLVKFVFRPFPTGDEAMHAAVAVQCSGTKAYPMLDELYSSIPEWYRAQDRSAVFTQKAVALGLNGGSFSSCVRNESNIEKIRKLQSTARLELDVRGTPTFFINGAIHRGKKTFQEMKNLLDLALKK